MKYPQQYTLSSNINQHFNTIMSFVPEEVTIEYGKQKFKYHDIKTFSVAPSFWNMWDCKHCGACCRRYYLIWDEISASDFKIGTRTFPQIKVNGKKHFIFVIPPNLSKKHCVWAEVKDGQIYCKHYEQRPLLSRMPHMFIRHRRGENVLIKRQFGRNWALGCKATEEPFDPKNIEEVNLPHMKMIQRIIKSYDLNTEIINNVIELIKMVIERQEAPEQEVVVYGKVNPGQIWFKHWFKEAYNLDKWL